MIGGLIGLCVGVVLVTTVYWWLLKLTWQEAAVTMLCGLLGAVAATGVVYWITSG